MSRENTKELPWDVIAEEILPKLHPKTLAACRCVSKLWNSHISGPNFVRQLNPVFRCYSKGRELRELYFFLHGGRWFSQLQQPTAGVDCRHYLWPLGSCNGVSCFTFIGSNLLETPNFLVWNPSVHRCSILVPPYKYRYFNDRERLQFCGGFGFDTSSGDYKVMQMAYQRSGKHNDKGALRFALFAGVYSVKARHWRPCIDINDPPPLPADIVEICWLSPQNSDNGRRIHWLAKREEGQMRLVVSFDFRGKAFSHVTLPGSLARVGGKRVELASFALGNRLTLFEYDQWQSDRGDCTIWVMREYGVADSWTKLVVSLDEPGRPLGFVNKFEFLFKLGSGKIASYHTRTKQKHYLQIQGAQVFRCVGDNYMDTIVEFDGVTLEKHYEKTQRLFYL